MKWYCTVCGYVHEGDQPPEQCPVCKQPASKFKLMEEDAEYATVHKLGEGRADGVRANAARLVCILPWQE